LGRVDVQPDDLKEKLIKDGVVDVVRPLVLSNNDTVRSGALTLLSNLTTQGTLEPSPSARLCVS
jgi:hypothetical protein